MATINVYLNFPGNTEEAFKFYRTVFGGEFLRLQRFKDTSEKDRVAAAEQEKIMHIQLQVAKNLVLHATDALESMGQKLKVGNNFSLLLETETKEESDQFFKSLSAGGKVDMPMQNTFWGAYYGMLTDKFGIQWMVNFELNPSK